jgi:hypothetical protein
VNYIIPEIQRDSDEDINGNQHRQKSAKGRQDTIDIQGQERKYIL